MADQVSRNDIRLHFAGVTPGTTDLSTAVFLEKLTFPRRPAVLSAYSGWSGTHPGPTDRLLDRRTPPPIQITKNTLTAIQMAIAAAT